VAAGCLFSARAVSAFVLWALCGLANCDTSSEDGRNNSSIALVAVRSPLFGQEFSTVVPPYALIQYPRFQLSAVHRRPKKKIGKLIKLTVHKFQNARQARTGRNMVKFSSLNMPST
jgi:hypothetical protein